MVLEKGVYTEIPDKQKTPEQLRAKRRAVADLRGKMAERLRKSDVESFNAQQDIYDLRSRRRINPETGKPYCTLR